MARKILFELEARDKGSATLGKFDRGIDSLDKKSRAAAPGIGKVGGALNQLPGPAGAAFGALAGPAGVAAGLGIAGGAMISALGDAREFNKGMTEVATLSPAAKREIDLLGQGVRDVAVLANQELPDATSAMYDMISAGVEVEDAGKALETAGKLAVGGVTTIATSTDLLTTAVNAWGAETVSAERVADIMFATVQKGKTTIDELGGSLFNVAPVAAAAGVSLEEIGAGAATLTAQGAPTSVAMTQMRNAIVELLKPSERLAPVWKAAGYESGEAAIQALGFAGAANLVAEAGNNSAGGVLKLVQSQEAVQAILGITGANLDAFRGNLDATTDSAGAAEGAFEEMSGTLDYRIGQLQGRFADLKLSAGQAFIEPAHAALDLVDAIGQFTDAKIGPLRETRDLFADIHRYAFRPDSWRLLTSAIDARNRELAGYVPGNLADRGGGYDRNYAQVDQAVNQARLQAQQGTDAYVDTYVDEALSSINTAIETTNQFEARRRRAGYLAQQETNRLALQEWSMGTDYVAGIASGSISTAEDYTRVATDSVTQSFADFNSQAILTATASMAHYDTLSQRQAAYAERRARERAEAEGKAIDDGSQAIARVGRGVLERVPEILAGLTQEPEVEAGPEPQRLFPGLEPYLRKLEDASRALFDYRRSGTADPDDLLAKLDEIDHTLTRQFGQSALRGRASDAGVFFNLAGTNVERLIELIQTDRQQDSQGRLLGPQTRLFKSVLDESISNLARVLHDVRYVDQRALPSFDGGGTVPGAPGQPMLAVVHGRERITPPGQGGQVIVYATQVVEGSYVREREAEDAFAEFLRGLGLDVVTVTAGDYA